MTEHFASSIFYKINLFYSILKQVVIQKLHVHNLFNRCSKIEIVGSTSQKHGHQYPELIFRIAIGVHKEALNALILALFALSLTTLGLTLRFLFLRQLLLGLLLALVLLLFLLAAGGLLCLAWLSEKLLEALGWLIAIG